MRLRRLPFVLIAALVPVYVAGILNPGVGPELKAQLLNGHIRYVMLTPMLYAEGIHFRRVFLPLRMGCPAAFQLVAREQDLSHTILEVDAKQLQACRFGEPGRMVRFPQY
jgi:hypothetical protein